MKKSFAKRYLLNKYGIITLVILIIVVGLIYWRSSGNKTTFESTTVKIGNIVEKVGVTGKISPSSKADLAFEKGGVVTRINFKIGDQIKKGDIIATLDNAGDRASLASAQAKLADVSRGLNMQELAAEQSKVKTASIVLANAKQGALDAARTAYVQSQSAVNNFADTFFNNPQSANPEINILTQSQNEKIGINYSRLIISDVLNKWKFEIDAATSSDNSNIILSKINVYESQIKAFMSDLSSVVNRLTPGGAGISQTVIDTYVSAMNSALTYSNQAISSITAAQTTLNNAVSAYNQASNDFNLKSVGQSSQSIAAQAATVDAYRAELAKDQIVSPLDGIVTRAEPNVGEFVSSGQTAFGVISDGDYKIEAYVPEADIAKIAVGNLASTTLDAYGQYVDFPATVTSLDPAETILEGVPTYKVTLKFMQNDPRIRSGMTANLDIITALRNNVMIIPNRAVVEIEGQKSARLINPDGKTYVSVPIQVGLKGSDGMIEVVSGLVAGQNIVTYLPK